MVLLGNRRAKRVRFSSAAGRLIVTINFLLPSFPNEPIGGYVVVYEYANALCRRGHRVRVIHPPWTNVREPVSAANAVRQSVKSLLGPLAARRLAGKRVSWFALDEGVEQLIVPDPRRIPEADATVATAWTTAPWVAAYGPEQGRGYYLIQHYEAWKGLERAVDATWQLPLQKIVIAKWLLDKAVALGEQSRTTYIPNGMDQQRFRVTVPIEDRRPARVGMLAHPAPWKGTADGLAALAEARKYLPGLEAVLFGTHPRPPQTPEWAEYRQLPSPSELVALYNSCAVFLHPSWEEGWPLPPAEAMACGCALAAAANQGPGTSARRAGAHRRPPHSRRRLEAVACSRRTISHPSVYLGARHGRA
jgi:glycosyltransferase involved in cell wall biosynthesis